MFNAKRSVDSFATNSLKLHSVNDNRMLKQQSIRRELFLDKFDRGYPHNPRQRTVTMHPACNSSHEAHQVTYVVDSSRLSISARVRVKIECLIPKTSHRLGIAFSTSIAGFLAFV